MYQSGVFRGRQCAEEMAQLRPLNFVSIPDYCCIWSVHYVQYCPVLIHRCIIPTPYSSTAVQQHHDVYIIVCVRVRIVCMPCQRRNATPHSAAPQHTFRACPNMLEPECAREGVAAMLSYDKRADESPRGASGVTPRWSQPDLPIAEGLANLDALCGCAVIEKGWWCGCRRLEQVWVSAMDEKEHMTLQYRTEQHSTTNTL